MNHGNIMTFKFKHLK